MTTLGTILPTKKSLTINDLVHKNEDRQKREIAKKHLSQYTSRYEQGENRYYDGATKYAIVNSRMQIAWFELRADGWYRI